ncbi:fatty acid desaturase family protein [Dictyobacter arantiisoli]|uniref:Delta fatty acid desaturase n=1 Tax=Dictyobacter arantiisoli TaxID=2014874 RepID=A0A5A5TJ46_9CHLR|nr:acyl-CoA desaturase [Dictyobacter arantiisoli]GCF11019.1 delta fatty acid desaturase [Dictyobacter arantiisoli]
MKKNALLTLPSNGTTQPSLVEFTLETSNREFAELKQLVKRQGLLEKQPAYYTSRIVMLAALLVASLVALCFVHLFWFQLLDAVFMAFVFAQIGLLSHEAGHRQMFHRSWKHDLVGLVGGNLLIGMSYAWWMDKHNRHHSNPNQVDMDPDIEIPFLEFTGKEDLDQIGSFRRFLVKHQAVIFIPALMTVSTGLQTNSFKFLLANKCKFYALEWTLLLTHAALYLALIFLNMNIWQGIVFIVVNQALTGFYLGAVFAPNHKGMPVLDKDDKVGFLYRQVVTSRNIYANPIVDFVYGGLNYQIEHHLFPSMPRNKLKRAQRLVKDFCRERNIPYHETHILESFREILTHLYHIGAPLRKAA